VGEVVQVDLMMLIFYAGNIRVFCRVRPLLSNERNARVGHLITPGMDIVKIPSARKDFQFDKVFLPSSLQGECCCCCSLGY
jgi:hypothetical protein